MTRPRCPAFERAVVEAYRGALVSQKQLAEYYGVKPGVIRSILVKHNAVDPSRLARIQRERWRRGVYDGVSFKPGRKAVWPDCPPELEPEYRRLRNSYRYPAAEARAMLERLAA